MPVFRNHTLLHLAKGVTAFLRLEAGLVRGNAETEPAQGQSRELKRARSRVAKQNERIKKLNEQLAREKEKVHSQQRQAVEEPASTRSADRLEVFRVLLGTMRPGRLLDLGCGHGKFSLIAHELGWDVTAVDARTERMPEVEGINWVRSDVREFEIGEYDCICLLGLLYHLELEDQLALLKKCAGTTTIIDTHVSQRAIVERDGYQGRVFEEVPEATPEQRAATPTAAWGNETAFWPTEESLMRMLHDSGFHSVFKMEPPHAPYRTFYMCLAGSDDSSRANAEVSRVRNLMPPEKEIFPGDASNFERAGQEFLGYFKELAGLQPDHRVLDVGCGIGRMAIPLTGYLNSEGGYEGFDVVRRGVRWCADNITPWYPNFHFQVADIHNERYNPKGKYEARDYAFPYEDESFDLVFLASVFTHMMPDEVDNYLSEISRVLKPGGRCLISYFLLNEESLGLIESGKSPLDFKPSTGTYRVVDPENPEHAVGYDEEHVLGLYAKHGLRPETPQYGSWCGRNQHLSYQDIIVAAKGGPTSGSTGKIAERFIFSNDRVSTRGPSDEPGFRSTSPPNGGQNTKLLISFCNDRDGMRPPLALVDIDGDPTQIQWIPPMHGKRLRGTTGLCRWRDDLICVTHQGAQGLPGGFLILDPNRNFRLVSAGELPRDPHSACSRDGKLYFAISSQDSVYEAVQESDGKWEVSNYWTFPGSLGTEDERHINGIAIVDGDLCVSGFELRESEDWDSATRGFIYDVDRGKYIKRGIHHPHSLLQASSTVWTCESKNNQVISTKGDELSFPSSYLRGLATNGQHFYAGSSKRRLNSKSTGKRNAGVSESMRGRCCIYEFDKEAGAPRLLVDFSEVRSEIYDLMLL